MKENTTWMDKRVNEPRSLQLSKYKEYQKSLSVTEGQNKNLVKLQNQLNLSVLKEDYDKFYNNSDKAKGDRYQAWLKAISNDTYVSENINIIKMMISNANAALK